MSGVSKEVSYQEMLAEQLQWHEPKKYKTSVVVYSSGQGTSIITHGEAKVEREKDGLRITVIENGIQVKVFFWNAGSWDSYQVIRVEA